MSNLLKVCPVLSFDCYTSRGLFQPKILYFFFFLKEHKLAHTYQNSPSLLNPCGHRTAFFKVSVFLFIIASRDSTSWGRLKSIGPSNTQVKDDILERNSLIFDEAKVLEINPP